jgi:hypothetical protein
MARKVTIGPYEEGAEAEINDLFNAVFGEQRDLQEWAWKFTESPADSRPLIALARSGGRLVGHYGAIALRLRYRDREIPIVQFVDNMVHEDFQGGRDGVYHQAFRRAESSWKEAGVALVIGFPDRRSYGVHRGLLGYQDLVPVVNLYRGMSWRQVARKVVPIPAAAGPAGRVSRGRARHRIARPRPTMKGIRFSNVERLDERADALWERVAARYDIGVVRDHRYLDWRYGRRPGRRYRMIAAERGKELVGLIVLAEVTRPDRKMGFILDCLAGETALTEPLVWRALSVFLARRVDHVLVRTSAADPARRIYDRMGFRNRPGIWDDRFIGKCYSALLDHVVLHDPSRWLVSFGDSDSV